MKDSGSLLWVCLEIAQGNSVVLLWSPNHKSPTKYKKVTALFLGINITNWPWGDHEHPENHNVRDSFQGHFKALFWAVGKADFTYHNDAQPTDSRPEQILLIDWWRICAGSTVFAVSSADLLTWRSSTSSLQMKFPLSSRDTKLILRDPLSVTPSHLVLPSLRVRSRSLLKHHSTSVSFAYVGLLLLRTDTAHQWEPHSTQGCSCVIVSKVNFNRTSLDKLPGHYGNFSKSSAFICAFCKYSFNANNKPRKWWCLRNLREMETSILVI